MIYISPSAKRHRTFSTYCLVVPTFWLLLLSNKTQSEWLLSSHLPVHTKTESGDMSEISHRPNLFLSWIITAGVTIAFYYICISENVESLEKVLLPSLHQLFLLKSEFRVVPSWSVFPNISNNCCWALNAQHANNVWSACPLMGRWGGFVRHTVTGGKYTG